MERIRQELASVELQSLRSVFSIIGTGSGFRPRDEELISFLQHKMHGNESQIALIPVIEICQHEPWAIPNLPELSHMNLQDPDWYFFSPIEHKYRGSKMLNRKTKAGFWKPTGRDRTIKSGGWEMGTKKTLVFYEGRFPRGIRTCWKYHELYLVPHLSDKSSYVLCHLMKDIEKVTCSNSNPERGDESSSLSFEFSNNCGEPSSNRSFEFAPPTTEGSFSEVNDTPQDQDWEAASQPVCQAADDDCMEYMNELTSPNESNTMLRLSDTYNLEDVTPNFLKQTSTYLYDDKPLPPYSVQQKQQYFDETPSSFYGENPMAFCQLNSYSPSGGYDFNSS